MTTFTETIIHVLNLLTLYGNVEKVVEKDIVLSINMKILQTDLHTFH